MGDGARRARSSRRRLLCLLATTVCALALGCRGGAAPSGPEPELTPDQQVLITLDGYDPMYKLDENGRVIRLRLIWRRLPPSVLAEVAKLTELRGLDLAFSTVDDDGLAQLKTLQKVWSLGLSGTPITERGLAHLEKLQSLQWVWVPKKAASAEALEKLKEARPDLNVYPQ
jgi:hypothetical protein